MEPSGNVHERTKSFQDEDPPDNDGSSFKHTINYNEDDIEVEIVERDSNAVDNWPLAMLTITLTLMMGASAGQDIIVNQYLYRIFAKDILGNVSGDTTRDPCGNRSDNDSLSKKIIQIQDQTTNLYLYLNITSYGIGMISNIILGIYSHLLHRRAQLLIPCVGFTIRCTVLLVVVWMDCNVYWLFLGFGIDGVCGTFTGVLMGAFLYSSDVTPRNSKRTIGITILEGTKGMMGGVSQVAIGFFLNRYGFVLPSIVVVALLLISIMVISCLPNRKPVSKIVHTNRFSFKESLRIVVSPFLTKDRLVRKMIIYSMFTFFIFIVIAAGVEKTIPLYFMDFPFCWSSILIGWFGCGRWCVSNLTMMAVTAIFYRWLPGVSMGIIGLVVTMGSYFLFAFAETTLQAMMGIVLNVGSSIPFGLVRGEASRVLDSDQQGPLFACFAVLESISFFLAPVIWLNVYRLSLGFYRGLPFLAASCAVLVPLTSLSFHQMAITQYDRRAQYKAI